MAAKYCRRGGASMSLPLPSYSGNFMSPVQVQLQLQRSCTLPCAVKRPLAIIPEESHLRESACSSAVECSGDEVVCISDSGTPSHQHCNGSESAVDHNGVHQLQRHDAADAQDGGSAAEASFELLGAHDQLFMSYYCPSSSDDDSLPDDSNLVMQASDSRQRLLPHYTSSTLSLRRSAAGSRLSGRAASVLSQYDNATGDMDTLSSTSAVFLKDTSRYWYKPQISRDDAITALKDKPAGSFVVRDSNSFPGAYGLALKVDRLPQGVQVKSNDGTELVRHFLIEPTAKGVKLKGCNNEPVFPSLAALVYQHTITQLALPCKLLVPDSDPVQSLEHGSAAQALLEQGAACNVTYIGSVDCESLTGPEAVRRAVGHAFDMFHEQGDAVPVTSTHFKVSAAGVTLTDNQRRAFFRRHYATNLVTHCGLDPEDRRWTVPAASATNSPVVCEARLFGFVARKPGVNSGNACHVFAELEPEQPATAIVNFVTKVLLTGGVNGHQMQRNGAAA